MKLRDSRQLSQLTSFQCSRIHFSEAQHALFVPFLSTLSRLSSIELIEAIRLDPDTDSNVAFRIHEGKRRGRRIDSEREREK